MQCSGVFPSKQSRASINPRVSTAPKIFSKVSNGLPEAALIAVASAVTAAIILVPSLGLAILVLPAVAVIFWVVLRFLHGKTEPLLVAWVLVFPLGYHFLTFPREKAIITLDRVLIAILVMGMGFAAPRALSKIPRPLSRSAIAWLGFLLVSGFSLHKAVAPLGSTRLVLDAFLLPALLGFYVIRFFRVRDHLATLHTLCCIMAIYVAAIGAGEFFTGVDLLPLPGGDLVFAGQFARPNGPFYSDDAFAIIGLLSFFFILFLRHALHDRWSASRQLLHTLGIACALASGLMPLFRSVLVTLVVILALDYFSRRTAMGRVARFSVMILLVGLVLVAAVVAPDAYTDRSRPDNFYFRIAGEKQFLAVFLDHPLLGIGIKNYTDVVSQESRYAALYEGVQASTAPHSNLGAVLSETGLVGFVPYVLSQILLIAAFYKLARNNSGGEGALLWKFFLYSFLSYWVSGLTLASGYSSETNLFFVFVLSIMYKYGITAAPVASPRHTHFGQVEIIEPVSTRSSTVTRRGF